MTTANRASSCNPGNFQKHVTIVNSQLGTSKVIYFIFRNELNRKQLTLENHKTYTTRLFAPILKELMPARAAQPQLFVHEQKVYWMLQGKIQISRSYWLGFLFFSVLYKCTTTQKYLTCMRYLHTSKWRKQSNLITCSWRRYFYIFLVL